MAATKREKSAKRPDGRPARARYWSQDKLLRRKLLALVRSGHTPERAWEIWLARGRRVKKSNEFCPTPLFNRLTQIAKGRLS